MTKQRSYQLLAFTEIKNSIGASQPGLTPPASEKQIRPLAKLEPEQQVAAWKNAVEIAGGERPTPKQVAEAAGNVSRNKTPPPKLPSGLKDEIRDVIAAALNCAWEQLQVYPEIDWQLFCSIAVGFLQQPAGAQPRGGNETRKQPRAGCMTHKKKGHSARWPQS